ncbi:MAG TPA: DUF3943 domain-containing protein [Saprospiraceae bacterium]|nr:DUF3943 domain-containing protein [Saprospiraceae bacterium]
MKWLFTVLIFHTPLVLSCIRGQPVSYIGEDFTVSTNTVDLRANYLRPILDITVANFIINRFNAYVRRSEWAHVKPSDWWINIQRGFIYDGDPFSSNWFGHPIHGSIFYNSARKSNIDYFKSLPYVMMGSLMWEWLGETEYPSMNDMITSTLGGQYMGEVLYRLTDHLWNSSSTNKTVNGIAGGLINPVMGMNRIAFGYAIPKSQTSEIPLKTYLSLGLNQPFNTFFDQMSPTGVLIELDIEYGNLWNLKNSKIKPFDYFTFRTWLNILAPESEASAYYNISSSSIMFGKSFNYGTRKSTILSVSQHYRFVHNHLYKIGAFVVTADAWWFNRIKNNLEFFSGIKGGAVVFGSGLSKNIINEYPDIFPNFQRDYIFGPGYMMQCVGGLKHIYLGRIDFDLSYYKIFSKPLPEGNEKLQQIKTRYISPSFGSFSLGLDYNYFNRYGRYYSAVENTDISMRAWELRFLLVYTL